MINSEVYSPGIVFGLTVVVEIVLVMRANIRYSKAVRAVRLLYEQEGKEWDYWSNIRLRLRLYRDLSAIFEYSDSAEIRLAKEELVKRRLQVRSLRPFCLLVLVLGVLAAILGGIVEYSLRNGRPDRGRIEAAPRVSVAIISSIWRFPCGDGR